MELLFGIEPVSCGACGTEEANICKVLRTAPSTREVLLVGAFFFF